MPGQLGKNLWHFLKWGIGVSTFVVGGGWAIEKYASQHAVRKPAALTPQTEASPALPAELRFLPEAGQRYTYSFRRKIEVKGLGDRVPPIAYGGKFHLDIMTADAKGFTAIASTRVAEYSGKEPPLLKLKMDGRGRRLELRAEKTSDEELRQYLAVTKDLLSLWAFTADTDTLGRYEARVDAMPATGNFLVQKKTKVKYLGHPETTFLSSAHWLKWDQALHLPSELKGEESTRVGQTSQSFESSTGYQIKFEEKLPATLYQQAVLARLNQKEGIELQALAGQEADFAKVDWNALAATLRKLDSLKPGERLAAFGDLAKLLRREPAMLAQALQLLSKKEIRLGPDSALFKTIVGALATAGTPEAQKALIHLYQDPDCPVLGKGTILGALTTTQAKPTEDTSRFLREAATNETDPDLAKGAAYALGSGLQGSTGESASAGLNTLRALWQTALASGNLQSQLSLLDAIGNSGREEFYPDLKTLVESQANESLRAKAAFSLRFINTPASIVTLATQVANHSEMIRESAVQGVALAPWTEQFRSPLQQCSAHEAVARIQKECEGVLGAHPQVAGN